MSLKQKWSRENIPDVTGKIIAITGANSGIGYEAARVLAGKHAIVVMVCRNRDKAGLAEQAIKKETPDARIKVVPCDLASLESIRECAVLIKKEFKTLDVLVNNAGVMLLPYGKTVDGFETHFGTNHCGHFALTAHLIDLLTTGNDARIVTVASMAHQFGNLDFDNLQGEKHYNKLKAYGASKLANLYFAFELQWKLEKAGKKAISVAVHPGWAATHLQQYSKFVNFFNRFLAQSPEMGALPTLFAATAPGVKGGDYYGPDGFGGLRGYPVKTNAHPKAYDRAIAERLWRVSEELTGIKFSV